MNPDANILQLIMNEMSARAQKERAQSQLTLGALIALLEDEDDSLPARVTPQYLAHVATRVTRYGGTDSPAQVAEAAASIYRALKRAKRDYRATLRGANA